MGLIDKSNKTISDQKRKNFNEIKQTNNLENNSGAAYVFNKPFSLAESVSCLIAGNVVQLQLNGDNTIELNDIGVFSIGMSFFDNTKDDITISVQPTHPSQICTAINALLLFLLIAAITLRIKVTQDFDIL